MKLLYTKRSPYARKVRIVALEKKISIELIEEDLTNKSALLIGTNPLGKIPTLILDKGEAIYDSPVICEYLDSLKASPRLIPNTATGRLQVLRLQAVADGMMDTSVAAYLEKIRHPENFNEQFIKSQEETLKRCLQFLENHMKDFQNFSLGSIALAVAIGYMNFRLPHVGPPATSALGKWFAEFSQRPSMQETKPSSV
jgi:glutathione S-transferase